MTCQLELDTALMKRLYISALKVVQEADESPKGASIPGDAFRELEIAVNFLRERQILNPSF